MNLIELAKVVFSIASAADPWLVKVDEYILCGQSICVQVRLKPDTAPARVLCSRTRGKYPLKLLKQLEDDIGLPGHPVQQDFDLVVGISGSQLTPHCQVYAPSCPLSTISHELSTMLSR